MIGDEDKERVREATDFVQLVSETVELRQRGTDWWGCCPFHHEKSPSFHVNSSTGLWKCFGCGEGGDVFGYVMRREGLEFPDAVRFLADRAGIELEEERGARRGPKRNRLLECLAATEEFYATMLLRGRGEGPDAARRYFAGRGFGSDICRRWGLGYAPGRGTLSAHLTRLGFSRQEMEAVDVVLSNGRQLRDRFYDRVMFPICDEQGRVIAFGGRVIGDGKPKYLNTKETSVFHKGKHLFAFNRAKEAIAACGVAVVCEGYTDVIAMHEMGFKNAVAALGTSFSADHVRTLARFAQRIVCMFDGDAAGQRAAERAIQFIDKSEADLRCVVLPGGQDPAEFLGDHDAKEMQDAIDSAQPLMSFVLAKRLEGVGPTSSAGRRTAVLSDVATILAPLRDSYVLEGYALEVAERLGFSVDDVRREIMSKPVAKDRVTSTQGTADYSFQGAAVPDEYVPVEAYGAMPDATSANEYEYGFSGLTTDERVQVEAERELLSMMAVAPDLMRAYDTRIGTFTWADARHEAMAWAMLSTPQGTPPAEVVRAAESVVPDAAVILASGQIAYDASIKDEQKTAFLLDTVELYSTKQRIRSLRAQLREGTKDPEPLFAEATALQKKANELELNLSVNKTK